MNENESGVKLCFFQKMLPVDLRGDAESAFERAGEGLAAGIADARGDFVHGHSLTHQRYGFVHAQTEDVLVRRDAGCAGENANEMLRRISGFPDHDRYAGVGGERCRIDQ